MPTGVYLRTKKIDGRLDKVCEICKGNFKVYPSASKQKTCSRKCQIIRRTNLGSISGKNHWKWKGGKADKNGYIAILKPNHPNAIQGRYVYEHRLVMEKKLGRFLDSNEIVHHIDGNKSNNSLNNLHLFSNRSEHVSNHWREKNE